MVPGPKPQVYSFNLTTYVQEVVAAGQSRVTIALVGDSVAMQTAHFNSTNDGSNPLSLVVSYQ